MNKEVLKRVIVENQEYAQNMKFVPRVIFIESMGNYVFVGPRRAGKTYLMYQIMENLVQGGASYSDFLYINFEDERLLELTIDDMQMVLDAYRELFSHQPILFLDEIQIVVGWEKFVRRLADSGYRVFVTGSNATMLSREIATTLGGRFLIKEVMPYSFAEFLDANGLMLEENWKYKEQSHEVRRMFDSYFRFGGFPEMLRFSEKRVWLENLYQKIFYGDLIARYQIRNDFALRLTVKKLAESVQEEISFNRIRNIIQSTGQKVGTATVIEYVSYLEESWLIFPVRNYLSKITERESQKKYYFIDNGIVGLFLYQPEIILLENIVACRLRQLYGEGVYYLKANVEVDFYIPQTKCIVQVCYDMSQYETRKRELDAMVKMKNRVECERFLVVTMDNEETIEYKDLKVEVLSVWKWMLGEL